MPCDAVRLLRSLGRLPNSSQHVNLVSYWLQVRRIETARLSAQMVKLAAFWDRPIDALPGHDVRVSRPAVASVKVSVPISLK